MLTHDDARTLAEMIPEPDLFPEAREQFKRELLDYFKAILCRDPKKQIPTVRRWM